VRKEVLAEGMELYLGDCREILPTLGKVDSIIADLPYGVTQNRWDNVLPLPSLWEMYHEAVRPGGVICLFGAEPFSSKLRLSSPHWKYDWYWEKNIPTGFAFAKTQPMRVIETISVFYDGAAAYNPQPTPTIISDRKVVDGRKNGSGSNGSNHVQMAQVANLQKTMVSPRNSLKFKSVPNAGGHKLHPTQKPVELMEYLIKTHTNENDIILDNAMGSGTTGVAALRQGRKFIGIEIEEKYFDLARRRLEGCTKREAIEL